MAIETSLAWLSVRLMVSGRCSCAQMRFSSFSASGGAGKAPSHTLRLGSQPGPERDTEFNGLASEPDADASAALIWLHKAACSGMLAL